MLEKFRAIPQKKVAKYAAVIMIIAVILYIYISTLTSKTASPEESVNSAPDLEIRLKEALSHMEGVGEVSVVINYDSTAELVPATQSESQSENNVSQNQTSSSQKEKEDVASVAGDALIIKEKQPKVRGVIVIAEGAQDISIRNNILSAVMTLLDVTAEKVEILY